jgi:hypothetical protein
VSDFASETPCPSDPSSMDFVIELGFAQHSVRNRAGGSLELSRSHKEKL